MDEATSQRSGSFRLVTDRLILRHLRPSDADFLVRLLNDPAFLRYIGDRGVRTPEQALVYLETGPIDSYRRHRYGLYLVERRADRAALGICGLVRRPGLDHADIGFALLPEFRSRGYAFEAAEAVLRHARRDLRLERVLAIVQPDNRASIELLERLGLHLEKEIQLPGRSDDLLLFSTGWDDPVAAPSA